MAYSMEIEVKEFRERSGKVPDDTVPAIVGSNEVEQQVMTNESITCIIELNPGESITMIPAAMQEEQVLYTMENIGLNRLKVTRTPSLFTGGRWISGQKLAFINEVVLIPGLETVLMSDKYFADINAKSERRDNPRLYAGTIRVIDPQSPELAIPAF
ncbi:MAG TPA: hypothetical protein VGT05_04050 [Patescibacteria group bacterium]|nr:hypothetical protein [Patescibacteria group bacterium]